MIDLLLQRQLDSIIVDIENLVEMYDLSYIDACVLYCESNDLEVEYVGEIVQNNPSIKEKIQQEAEGLHYIKKMDRLPINEFI